MPKETFFFREHIIVPLDQSSGQLKSTSPGLYRLPYFVYTGCRCRRECRCIRPLLYRPFTIQGWAAGGEEAGVEKTVCLLERVIYTSTLLYTGTPRVDDEVLV